MVAEPANDIFLVARGEASQNKEQGIARDGVRLFVVWV